VHRLRRTATASAGAAHCLGSAAGRVVLRRTADSRRVLRPLTRSRCWLS